MDVRMFVLTRRVFKFASKIILSRNNVYYFQYLHYQHRFKPHSRIIGRQWQGEQCERVEVWTAENIVAVYKSVERGGSLCYKSWYRYGFVVEEMISEQ